MKSAQQTVSNAVDFLFFRDRHRAHVECDRILAGLYRAKSISELSSLIIDDAAKAFRLASAALFAKVDDGGFVREAAVGWPAGSTWHLLPGDPLAAAVSDARGVASLGESKTSGSDLPGGSARPLLGVPLRQDREVTALVLYGAHESGIMLDPQEISSLKKLAGPAAPFMSD